MIAEHRRFKDALYEQFARIGKAASAPKLLELLELLCQAPRTVESLAEATAISIANASQHLKVLRAARLVESEKHGLFVEYRIADERVALFFHALRGLAETQLSEVEQVTRTYFEDRGAMEPMDADDLIERVKAGEATLIDVRPEEEFRAGHIPGAISIPIDELKARFKELPKDQTIVAYCRGRYCVMALEAVQILRKRGYQAERMEQGVLDWRVRRRRVERSEKEARS
jgi:rhodanese-related sulfurtransferase/DNA-binding transcriptional ArsR family regulator